METVAQGAEAIVYKDRGRIIKERLSKDYRLEQLDMRLRKFRTRREAKILGRLEELNFPSPKLQEFSDTRMQVIMDFIPGEKLRDVLRRGDDFMDVAQQVGAGIGRLHANDMIHGDLTTSNLIAEEGTGQVKFIDFGLSKFSDTNEDKAVDLFLLDRAIESTHWDLYPQFFDEVITAYTQTNPDALHVLERLQAVKKRGRHKKK